MGIFTSRWHLESGQNTCCHPLLKIIVASALPLILVAEQLGEGTSVLVLFEERIQQRGQACAMVEGFISSRVRVEELTRELRISYNSGQLRLLIWGQFSGLPLVVSLPTLYGWGISFQVLSTSSGEVSTSLSWEIESWTWTENCWVQSFHSFALFFLLTLTCYPPIQPPSTSAMSPIKVSVKLICVFLMIRED